MPCANDVRSGRTWARVQELREGLISAQNVHRPLWKFAPVAVVFVSDGEPRWAASG